MGNETSKQKGNPQFSRTDTSTSVRSGRSIRSRKSSSNDNHKPPSIRRRSSSIKNNKTNDDDEDDDDLIHGINNLNFDETNDDNYKYDYINDTATAENLQPPHISTSDKNALKLPPSMVSMAPKSPILRMNSSSSINQFTPSSTSPRSLSRRSSSVNINMKSIDGESQAGLSSQTHNGNHIISTSLKSTASSQNSIISNSNGNYIKTPITENFSIGDPTLDVSTTPILTPRQKIDLNIEDLIQRLLDAGYSGKRTKSVCLKNSEIATVCSAAREIFLSQPSLLELSAPVKIVGDVHGQYSDLIRIFTKCGFPPAANYLFLGDYVDRGKQSLETILLLLCYKIKYPENFFLLRGNHECAQITRAYGFYDECKRRTNLKTWKIFIDTFNTLPIAALVASKIFCVHGGLSPVMNSLDEIRNIKRPTDVPDYGLLNDLLWSDPADTPNEWEDNERGVSYCFNRVAINKFLNKFQFDLVVRAHMVVEDGYEFFNDRSLVTVFSAPNYCGEFDNWGAVMSVSEELLCSFELLDPLDSVALKHLMKKGKYERKSAVANVGGGSNGYSRSPGTGSIAPQSY